MEDIKTELKELTKITMQNTVNIERLTQAVERLTSLAETQIRHEEKFKTLFNDREDIYQKIDEIQAKVNDLIVKAEQELSTVKSSTDRKVLEYRVKNLIWLLGIVGSILGALTIYVIKH